MDQEGKRRLTDAEIDNLLARPALSIAEFARIFDLDLKTVYGAAQRREIPCIDVGRRRFIPGEWVRRRLAGDQS
jgi:hypothetical protein